MCWNIFWSNRLFLIALVSWFTDNVCFSIIINFVKIYKLIFFYTEHCVKVSSSDILQNISFHVPRNKQCHKVWKDIRVSHAIKWQNDHAIKSNKDKILLSDLHGFLIVMSEEVIRLVGFNCFPPIHPQVKHCKINQKKNKKLWLFFTSLISLGTSLMHQGDISYSD